MRNQSFCRGAFRFVHSRCWKFLRNVHNLFTRALWLSSPAGLRLEIHCEGDKKKMNFIFNCEEKIFLTKKMERARAGEKEGTRRFTKISPVSRTGLVRSRSNEVISLLDSVRLPRVDRIRLCAHFPASGSGGENPQRIADAGKRYRYHGATFHVHRRLESADNSPTRFRYADCLFPLHATRPCC